MQAQREVIEDLRERIRRIERRPPRSEHVVASGREEVDRLIGGGFPRGSLVELAGPRGGGKTTLALSAVARAMAEGALAAWVDGRGELYAPGAAAHGVDLDRLLIVRPQRAGSDGVVDALWAAEALLSSGAFAAVVVDVPARPGGRTAAGATVDAMLRRLQGAADKGRSLGIWLGEPGGARVPAAVRLDVAAGPEGPIVRRPGWATAARVDAAAGHAA
jgi:protein ImuA